VPPVTVRGAPARVWAPARLDVEVEPMNDAPPSDPHLVDGVAVGVPPGGGGDRLRRGLAPLAGLIERHRAGILLAIHVVIFASAFPLAYLLRFDGSVPAGAWGRVLLALPIVVGTKLAVMIATGAYHGWARYNSFADLLRVARAVTLASLAATAALMLGGLSAGVPRLIFLFDWAGTLLVIVGARAGIRLFRERYYPQWTGCRPRNVLVVGASETGLALAHSLGGQPQLGLRVVGFVDDQPELQRLVLGGIPVLGGWEAIGRRAGALGVEAVLVPTPSVPPGAVRQLMDACRDAGVRLQVVPDFDAMLSGRYEVSPRDVDLHDLLHREPIRLDGDAVGGMLRGRSVLVTGAAGSIGSELCRQILAFAPGRLILLDHGENGLFFLERELAARAAEAGTVIVPAIASITDGPRLRRLLGRHRPEVVFHAAAHKHVPMMEANPGEAIKNNVFGTRTLVDEVVRAGVEAFVMISTDKAVHPTSVMGACKRAAEMIVQSRADANAGATRLMTVRFGNVLGSNGSVVPVFKEQIRRGGPVTVTDPAMTRYFMTIPEATQLVLQAGALGRGGEIFVLDMGQPVRVLDLARDLIRLSGLVEGRDIAITYTGLRPGEKLYEELYDAGEVQLPTPHPKIFCARHRPVDAESLRVELGALARVVDAPRAVVRAALATLVPEYQAPARPATVGYTRETRDVQVPAESMDAALSA
jgi:FlaA1/EpsC-like NDP-sugar epimerase